MGLTVLEVEVGNPANPEVTRKVELLIDSGAIYSVIPTPVLEGLSIKPLARQEFELADGSKITRQKGIALFKYGDRIGGADVIFGEPEDSTLLGALPWKLWTGLGPAAKGAQTPAHDLGRSNWDSGQLMSSNHYTVSLHYDRRLYRHDIAGSIAHVQMLARAGTITREDADLIVDGLKRVRQEIKADSFPGTPLWKTCT